ncbi:unnamed protein product [Diplocarpon coronariae]
MGGVSSNTSSTTFVSRDDTEPGTATPPTTYGDRHIWATNMNLTKHDVATRHAARILSFKSFNFHQQRTSGTAHLGRYIWPCR